MIRNGAGQRDLDRAFLTRSPEMWMLGKGLGSKDVRDYIMKVGKGDGKKKAIKRNLSPLFTWALVNKNMASNPCAGMKVGWCKGVKKVR